MNNEIINNINWNSIKESVISELENFENSIFLQNVSERGIDQIKIGDIIYASIYNYFVETAKSSARKCSCNCNYCTCDCHYCSCNCNYCTCNCNYCTCNCNHACPCVCAYSG